MIHFFKIKYRVRFDMVICGVGTVCFGFRERCEFYVEIFEKRTFRITIC